MHLRQPGFTYSTCELFTKNIERIQRFNETGDSRYIYIKKKKQIKLVFNLTWVIEILKI